LEKLNAHNLDMDNYTTLGSATWFLIVVRLSYLGLSQ